VIAFRNPLFDSQLRRTIGHGTYGGAELGECLATTASVIDGDRESWSEVTPEINTESE